MYRLVNDPESVESCEVVVGPPKCSEVELVLPKQVSTRINMIKRLRHS